jgi:hypothetical protein
VIARRAVLGAGLASAAFGPAFADSQTTRADARLRAALADPAQRVRIRAKLFGSVRLATIHRISVGHVWAETPDEAAPRPLFSVINYALADWRPDGADAFAVTSWDSAVYCRFGTLERLETFENPYTGAILRPVSFLLGPMTSRVSGESMSTGGQAVARPRDLPLVVQGGMLSWPIASSRRMKNPLDRARFPASWGGEMLDYQLFAAFTAASADLLNPAIVQARTTSRYDEITPWPYWMEMGERPGRLIAHGFGVKLGGLDEADPAMLAALRAGAPAMFTQERWTAPRNDLTEFLAARAPA